MRVSIRSVVFFLTPVAVALALALWLSYVRSAQTSALNSYVRTLPTGRMLNPMNMVRAFGKTEAAIIMAEYNAVYRDTQCDGIDRWVQILHVPFAGGQGFGDGYVLCFLGDTKPKHGWTLPIGARIADIKIVVDQLVFRVFGKISQGSYEYEISTDTPKEFCLEWPAGSPVPQRSLGELMRDRFCIP